MKKAYREYLDYGILVVCLIRFDVSTQWWLDVLKTDFTEIRVLAGRRLRFEGAKHGSPNFASALVIYDPHVPKYAQGKTTYWDWGPEVYPKESEE